MMREEKNMMNLKEKVKNLPLTPGVYLMKDSNGYIIYVGKAKSLKKRVQSYFQKSNAHPQKIKKLIANLSDFDYILTDTEFEAFMLECKLIREIKPLFNKKMKSPQSYSYIVVQTEDVRRSLELASSLDEDDGNLYFGPYINKYNAQKAIEGMKEAFKISCSNPTKKKSPCLNYSLDLCIGMCLGDPALEQYNRIIDKIIALLDGTDVSILDELQQKMEEASDRFDFEAAAKYRNHLEAIKFLLNKERVIEFTEENKNIAVVEYLTDKTIKLFLIKGNQVLLSERHSLDKIEHLTSKLKERILSHFIHSGQKSSIKVSRDDIDEAQIIYSYLKSNNCKYIIIPENWLASKVEPFIEDALIELIEK